MVFPHLCSSLVQKFSPFEGWLSAPPRKGGFRRVDRRLYIFRISADRVADYRVRNIGQGAGMDVGKCTARARKSVEDRPSEPSVSRDNEMLAAKRELCAQCGKRVERDVYGFSGVRFPSGRHLSSSLHEHLRVSCDVELFFCRKDPYLRRTVVCAYAGFA